MDFSVGALLSFFSKSFTIWIVLPSLILFGIYLSWKLRAVQVTHLKKGFTALWHSTDKATRGEGSVSRYQAVATVVASGFGTGNISGMAVAIATGGPGALFWMWIMTFLGSVVQFANTVLGIKYRQKNKSGEYVGGPMYYMRDGLGWKKLATFFAFLVILAAFAGGDFVQVNSIALPLSKIGISPWVSGLAMAVIVGLAILGGAVRIAAVASWLVPMMAFFYIGGALIVLGLFHAHFFDSMKLILKSAFGFGPAMGGFLGFGMMQAVIFGFNRAIFATDAGTGIAPLLQSSACSKHPIIDGIATLVAPFMVMVVCTVTFLALVVTGAFQQPGLESTNMVIYAFSQAMGRWGGYIVFIALFLFGYMTLISMGACLDRAIEYLIGDRYIKAFRWLYILMVPVGALLRVNLAWVLGDIALTSMLVLNIAATAGLSKQVISDHHAFFSDKKKKDEESEEPATIEG